MSGPGELAEQINREYVWGPGDSASGGGGFDELLVQFDGDDWETRNIGWWSLHDATGDLVGLFDLDSNNEARLVAQWSYEPYGDVIAAEHLHPFPVQTLGHKGLFLDRLDNESITPSSSGDSAHRLVPFAHSIYHNRNRVYAPSLGRFLQQDPNQTAMGLLEGGYHGSSMGAAALAYSLEGLYGDGQNLYQYVASNPISNSDPTGLFVPDPSDFITGALESLVTEYSINLEWDVHWATNWSYSDQDHTRNDNTWIWLALGQGLYDAFALTDPFTGISVNPLDLVFGGRRNPGKSGPGYTPGPHRNGNGPYKHHQDPPNTKAGGDFTAKQKEDMIKDNKRRNGGVLRCDVIGVRLTTQPGRPNSVEIDHILAKSKGGSNSYSNGQVTSRSYNRSKGNRWEG